MALKISDIFTRIFPSRSTVISKAGSVNTDVWTSKFPFADTVFLNCVELLTDLVGDVTLKTKDGRTSSLFFAFKSFFETNGKVVFARLYRDGYVVLAHTQAGEGENAAHDFHICHTDEYRKEETTNETVFINLRPGQDIYVMRSATYEVTTKSDKQLLRPFLDFLDNVLNASNTVSERLGAFVVASPKNVTNAPAPYVLNEADKKKLEQEIGEEYGALHKQRQVMVLPREMTWQVVSLASLDLKTSEKARLAILAICDRIKVPANQVGIIDANSSKSLANGSELREGDRNKYQSFERLLDQTFIRFGKALGLDLDYDIYNKPVADPAPAVTI